MPSSGTRCWSASRARGLFLAIAGAMALFGAGAARYGSQVVQWLSKHTPDSVRRGASGLVRLGRRGIAKLDEALIGTGERIRRVLPKRARKSGAPDIEVAVTDKGRVVLFRCKSPCTPKHLDDILKDLPDGHQAHEAVSKLRQELGNSNTTLTGDDAIRELGKIAADHPDLPQLKKHVEGLGGGGAGALRRIHPNLQGNGALRSTAREIHSLAHPVKLKNQTIAIAEVRMPDGTRKIVASANTSAGLPANQQAALQELGIEIAPMRTTNGVKNHAEINILQNLPEGARVERWGISSGRHQVPNPCPECIGPVQQIGGNLEVN